MADARAAGDYFAACMDAIGRAVAQAGAIEHGIAAAGQNFKLVFAGPALVDTTLRPLIRRIDPRTKTIATIYAGDTESTGVELPRPPWARSDVTTVGFVPSYCVGHYRFAFDLINSAVSGADLEAKIGFQWLQRPRPLPSYLHAKPLRAPLHWFLQQSGLRMTHAAGVGRCGRGVLLTGRSGVGKSTSSLACAAAGMDFLGDDFVAIELGASPVAHNVFASANVFPDNLARFPALALGGPVEPVEFQHPHMKPKHTIFIEECRPGAVRDRLPIEAILVPVQGRTGFVRIGAIEALRALAPSSLILLPGEERNSLRFFAQLCQTVPCFTMGVGPDLDAIPAAIDDVLNGLP